MENWKNNRQNAAEAESSRKKVQRAARQKNGNRKTSRGEKNREKHRKRLTVRILFCIAIFLFGIVTGWKIHDMTIHRYIDPSSIETPDWIDKQLLTVNKYSRPGAKLSVINGIVIHYVANPGTTAKQNRDYFEGLKNQSSRNTVSVSSNFVIGLDGEIIECVPVGEKAYASNTRNDDTVSIECCHPESDGKFTDETYDSLVKLTAWLCKQLDLSPKDVIRHYDVTGKICPKYFVDHEDAWKKFRKDVKKEMKNG